MAKFCTYCGGPLNADGRCPRCAGRGTRNPGASGAGSGKAATPSRDGETLTGKPAAPAKKPASREGDRKKPAPKRKGGKKKSPVLPIILIALAVLILAFVTLCVLQLAGVLKIPFIGKLLDSVGISCAKDRTEEGNDVNVEPTIIDDGVLEPPDIDAYLGEIGEIVGKTRTESAASCESEAQVISTLRARGFSEYPITTRYAMDGTLGEKTEVSADAAELHPVYETYYATKDGTLWTISEINGRVFAFPATYHAQGLWTVRHIVSESDTYLYYDSIDNLFYEIAPNPSELVIIKVDRIDANMLTSLTAEEVAGR